MEDENLEMGLFNIDNLELEDDSLNEIQEFLQDETEDNTSENELDSTQNTDTNEDEDPEKVVGKEDQEKEGEDDDSPNLYSSFASVLNEEGLLPSLDLQKDKIESLDDLTKVFKSEINNQAKEYLISKIGVDGYDALEKGISLSEYQQHQNTVKDLNTVTEDILTKDIDLSKQMIYEDYISQGIDEKRALRILNKIVEDGDESIVEEAKLSLESLKRTQEIKLQKLQEDRQRQAAEQAQLQEKIDNDLKNSIFNAKEFIEGIPVTKAIKEKVYDSITKIVSKSPNGVMENKLMKERRENPINFDSKLYYVYELTNGFKDFSKLMNTSKSKAAQQLEARLRENKFKDSGQPSYLLDNESYEGLGSELVL